MGESSVMQGLLAVVMIVVLAVLGGISTYYWWRQLRAGADRPLSERLQAGALGFVGLALTVLPAMTVAQPPVGWLAAAVAATILPAFLLGSAWVVAGRVEYEQTRHRSKQLGLKVPRRMVSPWLIGLLWLLVTAILTLLATTVVTMRVDPGLSLQQQAAQGTAADVILMVAGLGVLVGGGHVWWQHRRREHARQRAIRRSVDDV